MSNDTDDLNHEHSLLASAYLDGEATPDERALVETSTDTLDEVDELSQLRAVLSATTPTSSISERESHLADALTVWDRMSALERSAESTLTRGVDAAAAAALLTPVSTSEGRRGRSDRSSGRKRGTLGASQWLLGAAAGLLVIAGAVAVVRGIIDEDPSTDQVAVESSSADAPQLSELETDEATEVEGGNVGEDYVPAASDVGDAAFTDPAADDSGLFPDDADAAAADATEESAEAAPSPGEQPAPAPEFDRDELDTPDQLADYGSLAVRSIGPGGPVADDTDQEPPQDSCEAILGLEKRLLPITYQGQDVNVGVDLDDEVVVAYTDDCQIVESVPLPRP